jgi:hypothetical protein
MAIIKAENKKEKKIESKEIQEVSLESQKRLAEILNDTPRLVSLNGTEWEVRALRVGTQWLICQKCIEVAIVENAEFGDIIKQFTKNIPALVEILTLALLNDKQKIFHDGDESKGKSKLFQATYDTLMWECKLSEFGVLLLETLQLIDVGFFLESYRMLQTFRESTMTRKTKTLEQK